MDTGVPSTTDMGIWLPRYTPGKQTKGGPKAPLDYPFWWIRHK